MKFCPTCNRRYSDSLQYCLADGTVLSPLEDPHATLRLDARPTQSQSGAKKGAIVGGLVVAAIAIVLLVVLSGVILIYQYRNTAVNGSNMSDRPSASNPTAPVDRPVTTRDELASNLETVNAEIGIALVQGDLSALDRELADDYYFSNDQGLSLTKNQILTLYRTGNLHYDYLTTEKPQVQVDTDLSKAVVTGRAKAKGQLSRQPFTDAYFYTNTFEKRSGVWLLVRARSTHP